MNGQEVVARRNAKELGPDKLGQEKLTIHLVRKLFVRHLEQEKRLRLVGWLRKGIGVGRGILVQVRNLKREKERILKSFVQAKSGLRETGARTNEREQLS